MHMRRKPSLAPAILPLLFAGCELDGTAGEPTAAHLEVHVQTWFHDTPVRVWIDGRQVLDDEVSTGAILAYAATISTQVGAGPHHLRARVDGIAADTTVSVDDTLYVGVDRMEDGRIAFHAQRTPFAYR